MRILARVMAERPDGRLYLETHRATIRQRGLHGWLAYQVGYFKFLWRARSGRIAFHENELAALAERLGTRRP